MAILIPVAENLHEKKNEMNIKNALVGFFCSLMVVGCSGGMGEGCCGWSGRDITAIGQVKKVRQETPIACPDYHVVNISLGVMRNGVGSMSTQDIWVAIPEAMVPDMKKLAEAGALINFNYDDKRNGWCVIDYRMSSYKVTQ